MVSWWSTKVQWWAVFSCDVIIYFLLFHLCTPVAFPFRIGTTLYADAVYGQHMYLQPCLLSPRYCNCTSRSCVRHRSAAAVVMAWVMPKAFKHACCMLVALADEGVCMEILLSLQVAFLDLFLKNFSSLRSTMVNIWWDHVMKAGKAIAHSPWSVMLADNYG